MSALATTRTIRWETWELRAEADRQFRRIVLAVGLPILVLTVLIAFRDFGEETHAQRKFDTAQYVQLLPEPPELAPPAEQPKPAKNESQQPPQPAKAVKPEVKPDKKSPTSPALSARDVASKSGVLQFADQLADLRDRNQSAITTQQPLNNTIASKGGIGGSSDAVAASAASHSGGINGAAGDVTTSQESNALGTRLTGAVRSPLGFGTDKSRATQDVVPVRMPSEVQAVLIKNQGPSYAIFNRSARENANIGRGKVMVNLTIAPSGAVTPCSVSSSTYNNPDFERKIVERVKLLNFGAKNVPVFTMNYPINFIPQ